MRVCRCGLLIISAILGLSTLAPVQAERVPPLEGVYFYQPAATVSGAEAVWTNPAGIGRFNASGFQLMADWGEDDVARSWGGVLHRQRFSGAYRYLDSPEGAYREYVVGFGFPLMQAGDYFGISYSRFKDSPGMFQGRSTWNIGMLSQRNQKFSWAAMLSNLNREWFESDSLAGKRSEMEQRYSVAYRPMGNKLTLAVDMTLSTKTRLSNADFVYHAEVVPRPGLMINGCLDSHSNFEIGFRANLLKYFVGNRSSFAKNGNSRVNTAFVGATDMRQASLVNEPRRRLAIAVSGSLRENPPQPTFGRKTTPFANLLSTIYRAAEDPGVSEMFLDLKSLATGMGKAQELRQAVRYFKSRSKRAICYLGSPGNLGYYVASAFDSVLIPPVSQLNLVGIRAELTFYGGLLEKLGVKADIVRIGDHKTAPEQYTHSAASQPNRDQINRLLDDLYQQFVVGIAEGRKLSVDSVMQLLDQGPFTSVEAQRCGLVDGLCYRDEVRENIIGPMPEVSFRHYGSDTVTSTSWGRKPEIAVIVAEGEISFSGSGLLTPSELVVTPTRLRGAFDRAASDQNIKAVVFRINSPGGLALAGEDIYRLAARVADKKPLIVSMGNVAASGGYYVAMPATRIFANSATVTGSIGIYGGKPDLSGLYEKLEVGKELYTRGRFSGMMSWIRPFSNDERGKYEAGLQAFYHHFLELVSKNRSLPIDSIDALSRGRVWTGDEALQNGLVDQVGGLKAAVDYTADLLELDNYTIGLYPVNRPLFVWPKIPVLGKLASLIVGGVVEDRSSADSDLLSVDGIWARMPYDIDIE